MKFWESGQILNMFQKQVAKQKTNILYIDTNEIYIESQNFVDPRFSKTLVKVKPKVQKSRPRLTIIKHQLLNTQVQLCKHNLNLRGFIEP